MNKLTIHIIVWVMMLCSFIPAKAQVAMPDTVCVGVNRVYRVNDASVPSTYTWTIDGVTQSSTTHQLSVTWSRAGAYYITVTEHSQAGCEGDTRAGWVYVNPVPVANAGPDATICFGATYQLGGSGGITYQWSPSLYLSNAAVSYPVATIPQAGTYIYKLRVSNGAGCQSFTDDSVALTVLPKAMVSAGKDTSLANGQSLQLNAVDLGYNHFISYHWSPSAWLNNADIANPVSTPKNSITYNLKATTDIGCMANASITIKVFDKPDIFVPNAFTPNADGLNDIFKAIPVGIAQFKYFKVFNRWGEMVFATSDPEHGWDGVYKGKPQNSGDYSWMAEGIDFQGNVIQKKGFVVLIR